MDYSNFSVVTKLKHECYTIYGSKWDETSSRLFVYCSLGTIYVWSFSGSIFTLVLVKKGYLNSANIN